MRRKKSLLWAVAGLLLLALVLLLPILYYRHVRQLQIYDERLIVSRLIHPPPLPTSYLAGYLFESGEAPNFLLFDCRAAEQRVAKSPYIARVIVKKLPPDTVELDYQMHEPYARVGDAKNTLVSRDGTLFPEKPYYHLPDDMLTLSFGDLPPSDCLKQLQTLLPFFSRETLKSVDFSQMRADSLGERMISVELEDRCRWRVLLESESYCERIEELRRVQEYCVSAMDSSTTLLVDLRLPRLAFVRKVAE